MIKKIIMSIRRWWWGRKGYQPLAMVYKRDWKVGMEGSMHEDIGPFIIMGIDPDNPFFDNGCIWVNFTRRHNDTK